MTQSNNNPMQKFDFLVLHDETVSPETVIIINTPKRVWEMKNWFPEQRIKAHYLDLDWEGVKNVWENDSWGREALLVVDETTQIQSPLGVLDAWGFDMMLNGFPTKMFLRACDIDDITDEDSALGDTRIYRLFEDSESIRTGIEVINDFNFKDEDVLEIESSLGRFQMNYKDARKKLGILLG